MGLDWFGGDEEDVLIVLVGKEVPGLGVWRWRHPLHPVAVGQACPVDHIHGTSLATIGGRENDMDLKGN